MKNIFRISGVILVVLLIILIHSCKKDKPTPPVITTTAVIGNSYTTATGGGNITSDGGAAIIVRGACWSESQKPTILDEKTIDGNGVGEFTSDIIGLLPNTTYYIRSYATNNVGTAYGNQVTLKTNELNLAILDVSKDKEWSYWVIAKDGSNYFVKLNDNNRPIFAYFKPDINNNGYSIFFDEKGLPSKMVVDNFVFIFSNYRDQLVDVALISPNGDINIQRDLKVSIDLDFFNKKSFITDLTFGLNITSKAIGIASCIGGLVTSATGVGAAIGVPLLIGCASTIVGIAATIFPDEVGAIGDNFKAVGLFASAAGCALGSIEACVSGAEKTGIELVNIALDLFGNENVTNADLQIKLPTITTNTVTSVFSSSAVSGGNISSTGGASIIARGICWSTLANPTTALSTKTLDGTGIGAFTSSITGLTANTTYYVRAYATNSIGTAYGTQVSFTTSAVVPVVPTLITTVASLITQTTATSGGNISSDGGASVTARGVCWSTSANPTTALTTKTSDGTGTGVFTSSITGLAASTTYYVRAYATNSVGTAYGAQESFTTLKSDGKPGTFTDSRDGHVYKTVIIGTQTWMAENLAYLPSVSPSSDRSEDSPFYYVYNYQGSNIDGAKTTTNYTTYGALYNWESAKKACPSDWYLPSDLDWTALTNYLSTSAGGKMKETGLIHWNSPNTGATNESGFSALPSGVCSSSFGGLGGTAAFWSSSENGTQNGYCRFLYSYSSSMSRFGENRATGFSIRCLKEPILATVTTANVTAITETSATCGGDIINCGSSTATDRGVCWNYRGAPTIIDNKISNGPGPGTGAFTSFITGLIAGAPYYLRAYVTNAFGTTYGEQKEFFTSGTNNSEIIFNPNLTYGTLTDIDGNVYKTIQIGTQIWMAENLKVTHYSNGDQILNVTDNTEWMNSTAGAYCWFHNDINNKTIYGALYNSRARMDSRKIAPTGWHVPTAAEWTSLANYLGGPQIAGGILKETGTSHWHVPNTGATNETGFTGLPGGYRGHTGKFVLISSSGWWGWEAISECRGLQYDSGNLSYIIFAESQEFEIVLGFSVRCVKD